MDSTTWIYNIIAAGGITVAVAATRFDVPSWSRTYTSAAHYRLAIAVQVTVYLVVLVGFSAMLAQLFIHGSAGRPSDELFDPASSVWLALLLTLCVRALSSLSPRSRAWFKRIARIPTNAHRFSKLLYDADVEVAPAIQEEVHSILLSRGINVDQQWLPQTLHTHRLLLRATALFVQVRRWEHKRQFARFLREAENDFDQFRHRFDQVSFRVSRTLEAIERLGEVRVLFGLHCGSEACGELERLDELLRRSVGDLIADSCDEIRIFYQEACLLTARGVLTTESTSRNRVALFRSLGFRMNSRDIPAGYGVLARAAALLTVGIWIFMLILPANPAEIGQRALGVVITVIVFGAFAVPIIPKLHWGFANGGLHGSTPIPFVIGVGLCTLLFVVIVNFVAGALMEGGVPGGVRRLYEAGPFLHCSPLIAVAMAWLIQDHRWSWVSSPMGRRLYDAAVLASVWMAVGLLARLFLSLFDIPHPGSALFVFACCCAILGGVTGYAIPESVRVDDMRNIYRKREAPWSRVVAGIAHRFPT